MKSFTFLFCVSICLTITFFSSSFKSKELSIDSNFSGKWILNLKESEVGSVPISNVPSELKIEHSNDSITITRWNNQNDLTETLIINGNELEISRAGGIKRISSIKSVDDNRKLIETVKTLIVNTNDTIMYLTTHIMELKDANKNLIITTTYQGNLTEEKIRATYERKD